MCQAYKNMDVSVRARGPTAADVPCLRDIGICLERERVSTCMHIATSLHPAQFVCACVCVQKQMCEYALVVARTPS